MIRTFFRSTPSLFSAKTDKGIFRGIPLPVPGRLFVSPMPYGAYDVRGRVLKNYLRHQIEYVMMLVTDEELATKARTDLRRAYSRAGIAYSQHPLRDYQSTSIEAMEAMVDEAEEQLRSAKRLALHCHAGVGRTALVAACITNRIEGVSGNRAIEHVRANMQVRMTAEQTELVRQFSSRRAA